MSQNLRRWLISGVLILGLIPFLGISLLPLLRSVEPERPAVQNTVASPQASPVAKQQELEAQAKGYELVLQREPENQTALKGLLETRMEMVRLKMADVKDVIAPLEKLSKLNPDDTEYAVLLAQSKAYSGDLEGSATVYRSLLKSKPGDLYALQGLASLLLEQKRPEAAIGLLQNTLDTAPKMNQVQPGSVDETAVKLLLASVYAEEERYNDALSVYDQVIKTNQQDFRPVLGKALVLQKQGKKDEAQPLFTAAANLAPAQYKDQINQRAAAATPTADDTSATPPAANPETTESTASPAASPGSGTEKQKN